MLNISDIVGMPVISLANCAKIGCVANLWFDAKFTRLKSAEIIMYDENDDVRYFASADKLRIGEGAALISSAALLSERNTAAVRNPVNSECYNIQGSKLGYVCDAALEGTRVISIAVGNAQYAPDKILRLGEGVCVVNDTDEDVRLPKRPRKHSSAARQKPKPKSSDPEPDEVATQEEPRVQTPSTPLSVTVTHTPPPENRDYGFLLGKTVRSHIVSNGRVLIGAGTVVDENVIEFARRENKLVRLALWAY